VGAPGLVGEGAPTEGRPYKYVSAPLLVPGSLEYIASLQVY